jgi:hypothetical protein
MEDWDSYGHQVPYASSQSTPAGQWLRAVPHRLHLGRIGLRLADTRGKDIAIADIKDISQTVDLWQGIVKSSFRYLLKKSYT